MPDQRRQQRHGDADEHRRPGAVQDPAEEVAAHRVGAQRMVPRLGGSEHVGEDGEVPRVRRQEVGEDGG